MANVIIYSKDNCPYCDWAKQLLEAKKIDYSEIRVDRDNAKLEEMVRLSGRRTVPQIFINDEAVGGYDDLSALAKAGRLDQMLNPSSE
jgi:glutaredoxin 3